MITITVQLVRERERVHSFIHLILDDHLFPRHFPPRQMLKVVTFESWVLEQIGAADNGHCCCLWPVSVWHNQSQCKAVSSFKSGCWKWCGCLRWNDNWQGSTKSHQQRKREIQSQNCKWAWTIRQGTAEDAQSPSSDWNRECQSQAAVVWGVWCANVRVISETVTI